MVGDASAATGGVTATACRAEGSCRAFGRDFCLGLQPACDGCTSVSVGGGSAEACALAAADGLRTVLADTKEMQREALLRRVDYRVGDPGAAA